jgi:hypothetical protein
MSAPLSPEDVRAEVAAKKSLIDFRAAFFASRGDVAPAPFHYEWSETLLNGKGHAAVEAFRESAKTQIVLRANLLHALAYPSRSRSYIAVVCATKAAASKKLRERMTSGGIGPPAMYSPSADRKSGMPDSVDTPAPPKNTIRSEASIMA